MLQRRFLFVIFIGIFLLGLLCVPGLNQNKQTASAQTIPCNWIGTAADITVSDGSVMSPGQNFIKTWRLTNIGACTWTTAYNLVYFAGEQMGSVIAVPLPNEVPPGQSVSVSVPLTAPSQPGYYRGYWLLQSDQGFNFGLGTGAGDPFWVSINVSTSYGVAYDFAARICEGTWRSGAGKLPCPGLEGDWNGYAVQSANPRLENGVFDSLPGILVFPQNRYNGYIQGTFPPYVVQKGDRFQAIVGCAYESPSCLVTFRLDYQTSSGFASVFWKWNELSDGKYYRVDKDLSYLEGATVRFTLTILAAGYANGDRAIWAQPRIVSGQPGARITSTPTITLTPTITNTPTITPTPTKTLTPTITNTPSPTPTLTPSRTPSPTPTLISSAPLPAATLSANAAYDFAISACTATWSSGAGALPCPGADKDARGFSIPVENPQLESGATDTARALIMVPQTGYNTYVQGVYPYVLIKSGDRFQSIVSCAYGFPCYATFRISYMIQGSSTVYTLWSWTEQNEGLFYRQDTDLSSLAGKNVRFILNVNSAGYSTGDRVVWSQPRIYRLGANPVVGGGAPVVAPTASATPSPAATASPTTVALMGAVTNVTVNAKTPATMICASTNPVNIYGVITTNGAATLIYHWEYGGDINLTKPDVTINVTGATTLVVSDSPFNANCGNYTVRLVVTSPNALSAQTNFAVIESATATPSPTP